MTLYEGPIFRVERRESRDVVVHAPVAAVIAIDTDGRLALVRQRRVAVDETLLELPAGFIDDGESPLDAARRELAEETGLHGGEWTELTTFFTSAGFTDERVHLFSAVGVVPGEASPDDGEELEVVHVPVADAAGLIGSITDAKTLIGLLLLASVGLPAA